MKKPTLGLLLCVFYFSSLASGGVREQIEKISRQEMQSTVEFLSHDLLEGRAPGTRGGQLAELYMKSIFKLLNLQPGFPGGNYMQPFRLKGFKIRELQVEANNIQLTYLDDVVGIFAREEGEFQLEGNAIFVGFGITADLWQWDDYKNTDVRDKIVIARVNDPGIVHSHIFEGKTLTYFGRWIYHIEEAARRGAAGIILIHTDETAGYGWNVVVNSWSGEEVYLEADLQNNLKFRAWIKEASLRKLLNSRGISLDRLYALSIKRNFKPVDLGFKIKVKGKNDFRELMSSNVAAEIPGRSPKRIVISAHIDHLGMMNPEKDRDTIFNGAIDNCSAVASMIMVAKILKQFSGDLYYTVTFLACNSEEAGLLGSKYYVQNTEREDIIANINFESTPVWERARSIMGIGARFSSFEDILKKIAENEGLRYSYFSMANQGFFYRSDQFSFARYNIPSIWISAGEDDISGNQKYDRFWKTYYHTVDDEYDPQWELEGMKQTIQFALLVIEYLDTTKEIPRWKEKLTFPLESGKNTQQK